MFTNASDRASQRLMKPENLSPGCPLMQESLSRRPSPRGCCFPRWILPSDPSSRILPLLVPPYHRLPLRGSLSQIAGSIAVAKRGLQTSRVPALLFSTLPPPPVPLPRGTVDPVWEKGREHCSRAARRALRGTGT